MIKSFKEFIAESALERKLTKGFSDPPVQIPGADIIHHDPEKRTTIYHLKKPEACYKYGNKASWCTNTKNREFAHSYLKAGNVFGIVHGANRYQYHHIKKANHVEFRDTDNKAVPLDTHDAIFHGNHGRHVLGAMLSTKHRPIRSDWKPPRHPYSTKPEGDVVKHVLSLPASERLQHYNAIHFGQNYPQYHSDEEENNGFAIAARFNTNDLHKFHSDPDHHDFIATHGNLDQVAHHMKDHPDPHTRKIVANRIKMSGGEANMIKPDYEHYHSDHPGQGGLNLTGGKMRLKTRKLTR